MIETFVLNTTKWLMKASIPYNSILKRVIINILGNYSHLMPEHSDSYSVKGWGKKRSAVCRQKAKRIAKHAPHTFLSLWMDSHQNIRVLFRVDDVMPVFCLSKSIFISFLVVLMIWIFLNILLSLHKGLTSKSLRATEELWTPETLKPFGSSV